VELHLFNTNAIRKRETLSAATGRSASLSRVPMMSLKNISFASLNDFVTVIASHISTFGNHRAIIRIQSDGSASFHRRWNQSTGRAQTYLG
jgi:hypothetical protein